MDKRIEQARQLLTDRERRAVVRHLNDLSDEKAIKQLKKAISFYKDAPDLDPCDLQKLIDEFQVFSVQVEKKQNEIEEKLLNTLEEVFEYNRTGINPYSKKQMAQRLEVEEQELVYEDNSLLSLLIDLNSKCSSLDEFIGGLKDWPHSCSKRDWQKRIEKLLFLKELYPIRENISEIISRDFQSEDLEELELNGKKSIGIDISDLQGDSYWETAFQEYNNQDDWEGTYEQLKKWRTEYGLESRYTNFKSFKRGKTYYSKKRTDKK